MDIPIHDIARVESTAAAEPLCESGEPVETVPPHSALAALRDSLVLHLLPAAALKRLASAGAAMSLTKGATLCQSGDVGDAVYVVLQGEIEVLLRSADGREVRVAALGSGAF